MGKKMRNSLIALAALLNFGAMANDNFVHDAACVLKRGEVKCSEQGFLHGDIASWCKVDVKYKNKSGEVVITTLEGYARNQTNTGAAGILTLGLTDAIMNPINYLNTIEQAKSDLESKFELVDNCDQNVQTKKSSSESIQENTAY